MQCLLYVLFYGIERFLFIEMKGAAGYTKSIKTQKSKTKGGCAYVLFSRNL